ncbi:MAG: NUDIX domain-containing protein [Methanomassiliicoccales archaeon]|nr:NUDIX domain-containing protein [Methanomassiliicoccales archaeon]
MPNVYAIGFRDERFLMVYNPKRKGWEMPGGKLEEMETPLEGVMREYMEECGFELQVLDCRPMGAVVVFAGVLGEERGDGMGALRRTAGQPGLPGVRIPGADIMGQGGRLF